ncbi:hypothetical protein DFJ43DRAFT_717265 [Lentinula guzmanii]|uniref:Arrestin-like N-terminal domain-containing protein n=1 Tax=Lentinula guzmanii TaxID=2804957 RepID=A0AA38MWY5_9AGAR|nr:hypothetical protein DFJ43DRAFT_717265 [Lentinula guzmanii]
MAMRLCRYLVQVSFHSAVLQGYQYFYFHGSPSNVIDCIYLVTTSPLISSKFQFRSRVVVAGSYQRYLRNTILRHCASVSTMLDSSSSADLPDFEVFEGGPELPLYTRRPSAGCSTVLVGRQQRKFRYSVEKSLAGPGITLTVYGDSKISNELPSFMAGDRVAGVIQISVNNGEDIRAVHISLRGRVLTGRTSDAVCTFLDLQETLWTEGSGSLEANVDSTNESDYIWPYSLVLPKDVAISQVDGEKEQVFPLPHTFTEPGVPARVQYELEVFLKQTKWKRNRRIATEIGCFQSNPNRTFRSGYIPSTSSFQCAEADGVTRWKALDFDLTGIISQFHSRTVHFFCTLSLKDPLCYTRGSYIPLLLKIRSQDRQALELISSPDAAIVQLNRRINYKDVQMCGGKSSRWSSVVETVGVVTWKSHEGTLLEEPVLAEYSSTIIGKVKLKRDLAPSSVIANMAIEYFISVHPFSSPSFQPKDNKSGSLLSQMVQITTDLSSLSEYE